MYRYRFDRTLATCLVLLALTACGKVATTPSTTPDPMAASLKPGGGGSGGGHGGSSAPTLVADANVHSMNLTWNDDGVSQYNAYVSSSPNCDTANYTLCPAGQMFVGVRSPYKVGGLENGRVYYAKVETTTTSTKKSTTTTLLSNEAGARPTTLEFNGSVRTIATTADGTKYLGGEFTRIGLTSGQAVPLDAVTGKPSVPGFPIIGDGGVSAAAPDGSGGWYVGGDFQRASTLVKRFLVHVRADGTVDPAWNPVPDGSVWAIAVMNGVVYIGGRFSTINGQMRTGVAAIDAVSGQLMAWNPNPDLGVTALAAANGTIYIGGTFTMVGAFRRSHLAAVDAFGNVLPWDPSPDGLVDALAVSGSTVYAGGFFDNVGGEPRSKLAAIDATSGKPTAWNASLTCVACEVRAIAVYGTTVYVGGRFTQIKGVARNHIAAVDTNGNVLAWNPNAEYTVWSLAVIKDSTRGTVVYAGGEFAKIGGQPYAYLAAIDAQGAAISTWQPAPTASVEAVVAAGSQVLAGGRFTGLGATVRMFLAAIDATGALKPWNPNANGAVLAMVLAGDTIYIGGSFDSVGGQPRGHLAMLDTTGAIAGWNPGTDWPVLALARGATGTLYVGGEFAYVAGTPRGRLAAFGASGQLLGWAPNADYGVRALAVGPYFVSGETVYVGGRFGVINGQMRRRIAQIDEQGQLTSWNPWGVELVGQQEVVNALRYSDGMIYAGGLFTRLGRNVAQITETGTINQMQGADLQVWSLALADSQLTIGGDFTQVLNPSGPPTVRNRVATIDTATHALTAWAPNIGVGTVYAVAPEGASVHIGGSFTQVNDQVVSGFATLAK